MTIAFFAIWSILVTFGVLDYSRGRAPEPPIKACEAEKASFSKWQAQIGQGLEEDADIMERLRHIEEAERVDCALASEEAVK